MALPFLACCCNMKIGSKTYEPDVLSQVKAVLDRAAEKACRIVLPCDWVCARCDGKSHIETLETQLFTDQQSISEGWLPMDCGPSSVERFVADIFNAKTVLWRGSAGHVEIEQF